MSLRDRLDNSKITKETTPIGNGLIIGAIILALIMAGLYFYNHHSEPIEKADTYTQTEKDNSEDVNSQNEITITSSSSEKELSINGMWINGGENIKTTDEALSEDWDAYCFEDGEVIHSYCERFASFVNQGTYEWVNDETIHVTYETLEGVGDVKVKKDGKNILIDGKEYRPFETREGEYAFNPFI